MKGWFRISWRWSLVITLPVTCLLLYWGGVTVDRFYTFGVRYQNYRALSLHEVGVLEFKHLIRLGELSLSGPPKDGLLNNGPIRTIQLFIPEANLAGLDSHLPQSGYRYVKGGLWDGDKIRKVKLRYRGDSIYHWGSYKKSLRIKTKKDRLFEGMRSFNLVAPRSAEILNNYLSFRLGSLLGLISPKVEMVNVAVNGKNNGIYVLTEQLEELTLRNHNRMPGDLYSGELIGLDKYRGTTDRLFYNAELWEKVAVNNHYPEESRKPLERLILLVNANPTEEVHAELAELIDMEAFGRFSALEILTGTAHVDDFHNWRLYYDPMRGRFVPVVWDLVGWGWPINGREARLDVITSPLHLMLHQNAAFLRARDRALKYFFMTGLDKEFLGELSGLLDDLTPYVHLDPLLAPNLTAVTPAQTIQAMADLKNRIEKIFIDTREGYCQPENNDKFAISREVGAAAISIAGRSAVDQVIFEYLNPLSQIVSGQLGFWHNNKQRLMDISGAIKQQGSTITVDLPLIASFYPEIKSMQSVAVYGNRMIVSSGHYEFIFAGISPDNTLREVKIDRGLGGATNALKTVSLERKDFKDTFLIAKAKPVTTPLIWSGEVVIDGVQRIEGELLIHPGTVVRFSPGASLVIKGRVNAKGALDKPIRFIQNDLSQEPWGTVALVGKAANGSRFKYVEFAGGSGLKSDLFEYTAMLSIHDVKDVEVANCTFRDSMITDDMVHVVYSEVRFSDCLFERSLMDALDIDISDAVIERCHFIQSGNDAIDLMTSTAVVVDTLIENGGDKAVSVGEGSHLLAINNVFRNNVIGVQAKDGSMAALYNVDLEGNGHALDAYKKNWRYDDGGNIYLYKSRVVGNNKMITADKKSKISVYDTYIDKPVEITKKSVKLADTVDTQDGEKAREGTLDRNKKEILDMKGFDTYWEHVDPTRRGALDVANH
jgi:hypothetical protein